MERRSRRKPKKIKTAINLLGYFLMRGICGFIPSLPFRAASAVGEWLGTLVYLLGREERNRALRHLRWAFGEEILRGERRRIALQMFRNFGRAILEALAATRLSTPELEALIENPKQAEDFAQRVLAEGAGLIAMTGHLGNWEMLGNLGARYMTMNVVANRFHFEPFNRLTESLRSAAKLKTIYLHEDPREIIRALKRNEAVGLLPDQDIRRIPGTFVRFFGRPAWTPIGPVLCAKLSGAPMVPLFLTRRGRKYRVEIGERIPLTFTGNRRRDLQVNTQRWSDAYEAYIRQYPDQWGWNHLRWKTRPADLPPGFRRNAALPPEPAKDEG
ncbi:MAG: lysophospholipid acyltransferase family protein [Planctomycetota bacterium]|jgi:KDO2-lipid IV(A) lauroyltransferase